MFPFSIDVPLSLSHSFILACYLIISSPTGQQFLSCKDVASYLESFFGLDTADGGGGDGDSAHNIQEDRIVATENVSIICAVVWFIMNGLHIFSNKLYLGATAYQERWRKKERCDLQLCCTGIFDT